MQVDERGRSHSADPEIIERDPEITVTVTPSPRRADRPARRRPRELPTWFIAGLAGAIVWIATAVAVATTLLAFDWYRPSIVILASSAAALAVVVTVVLRLGHRRGVAQWTAIAAVAVAVGFFAFAGAFHSEHVLTDRDPGIYVNNGRSIARTHELHPTIRTGPYTDAFTYSMEAAGFGDSRRGLEFDLFPGMPALLAVFWSLGGDRGMLLLPSVLGALGVLVTYALASRVIVARAALLAVVFFVAAPLQLWFARDAYSELLVQVVTLGGIWLYLEARARTSPSLAAVAGAVIASSAFARIDTMLIVVGTVLFIGLDWTRADDDADPRRSRRTVGAFAAGLGAMLVGALLVTDRTSHNYVKALRDEYRQTILAVVAAVVVAVVMVVVHRFRPGIWRRIGGTRIVFVAIGVAMAAAFVYAYWLRPEGANLLPTVAAGERPSAAVRQAINEWHWGHSLRWLASYYGAAGIALAAAGLALLLGLGLRGNRAATAVSFIIVPVTVLYIARPSISPDQPWAMRRYLPVVLPGIALAIAAGLAWLWWQRTAFRSVAARAAISGVTIGLGVAAIIPSAIAAPPLLDANMQDGAQAAVYGLCDEVGPDGAVFVYGYAYLDALLPQTVRGFCGIPAAKLRTGRTLDMPGLSAQWQQSGRKLFVATGQPVEFMKAVPTAIQVGQWTVPDGRDPERVAGRRPERTDPKPVGIWLYAIPPGAI